MRVILAFILVWASSGFAKHHEMVACIDDHPPYQILGDTPTGTHIEALRGLAEILDKQITFIESPNFARCLVMLERGTIDVVAGLNPTEERNQFAFYAPFKQADKLRVVSKSGIVIKTYDDFDEWVIGVPRGTSYFARFDNDNSLRKIPILNNRTGFTMLAKGRIDLMMTSPAMISLFAKEIKEANLKVSPIALEELRSKVTNFGFSKKHRLKLKDEEIIKQVVSAFYQGRFEN